MKIQDLVENDLRTGSTQKLLDTFINRVEGMELQQLQMLVRELINIGNNNWGWDMGVDPNETNHTVLTTTINNLANELEGDKDFSELVGQVLGTDEIHPPG